MGNSHGKPVVFTDQGTIPTTNPSILLPCPTPLPPIHSPRNRPRLTFCLPIVNLNHFRLLRVVGKGAFGKVRIVERKDTGCTFALKYIRKDEGTTSPRTMLQAALGPFSLPPSLPPSAITRQPTPSVPANAVSQLYAPRACAI